jgi:hypothetical protein
MKRVLVAAYSAVILAAVAMTANAANGRGTAKLVLNGKTISVEYGRPALNGRTVDELLGQLPAGEDWRLGADKSTTFTTTANLKFGDVTIPKGEYSIWARKESDGTWKLVFNKQHGQWGAGQPPKGGHDAAQDLASVPLAVEKPTPGSAEKPPELFTVSLEKEKGMGEISFEWGTLELTTLFK